MSRFASFPAKAAPLKLALPAFHFAFAAVFCVGLETLCPVRGHAGEDVADLIRRGVAERKAGNDAAAVRLLREAVRLAPGDSTAHIETARTLGIAWESCYEEYRWRDVGRTLWTAPEDLRAHGEAPYRWSIFGEQGLPNEPPYDETYPVEVLEMRERAEAARRLDPSNPVAVSVAAYAALFSGDPAGAELFASALRMAPEDPAVRRTFAVALLVGILPRGSHDIVGELEHAVRLAPDDVGLRVALAAGRQAKGDSVRALEEMDLLLKREPENGQVHRARGVLLAGLERHAEAVEAFSAAIRLRPDVTFCYIQSALARAKSRDHEGALRDLDRLASIDARNRFADQARFAIYRALGRHEEALQVNDRLIERFPYNSLHWGERSLVLADLGRTAEAKDAMQRAKRAGMWMINRRKFHTSPEDENVWLVGGKTANWLGEWEAAKKCYVRAVELMKPPAPLRPLADAGIARASLGLGDYHAAVEAAGRAIEGRDAVYETTDDEPKGRHSDAYEDLNGAEEIRAEAYMALGEFDAAIADYEATGVLGDKAVEAYRRRAEKREAAGDKAGAAEDRRRAKAISENPFAAMP